MVSVLMMQAMAIHPADGIYIKHKNVIHDRDDFYEPYLVVERAMNDAQMEHIGQIQPAHEPAKNKISAADQQCSPGAQMSRSEKHASQQIEKNNQIAREVVYLHDDSFVGPLKQKSEPHSNNKLMMAS